jgi:hypothetical protein
MSKPNEHSWLTNAAAKAVLQSLGFRQKGQSRLWLADRGFWALVVEFQPSGFSKGSYLNIAASWLWHPGDLPFNYCKRAGKFIEFFTLEQFELEAEWLADQARAEVALLDKKFRSLDDIAAYLKQEACDPRGRQNPWTLYHAAIGAGLTGAPAFALECFNELVAQRPTADWEREIQAEAKQLARLLVESKEFRAAIYKKVEDKRATLKLPLLVGTS